MPHSTRFPERPPFEHAGHRPALQPVPQRRSCQHGSWNGRGVVGNHNLYELPYLHPWLEHECGVPQVGVIDCNAPGELRRRGRTSIGVGIQGLDEHCFSIEAFMMNPGWISRPLIEKHSLAARCIIGSMAAAILGLTAGTAVAQLPIFVSHQTAPDGYTLHESIDLGGHVANINGSGAMYDTLVNQQSGPRILGETYELRALPGTKNTLVDRLKAFTSGLGGDPYNVAKLDYSKGELYDFSGMFRRDRQYFDYNLLGNPNLPPGQSIPIGPVAAPTGSYAWPQVTQSPFMFNTVRRMTDTNLTLLPLSKWTFRVA